MPVNTIPRPEVLQTGQTVAHSAAGQSQHQQADTNSHHKHHKPLSPGAAALPILVAEADSCAPELVGIPYHNFSAIQRRVNYQRRKDNHKCTACGNDDRLDTGCLMWRIRKIASDTKMVCDCLFLFKQC